MFVFASIQERGIGQTFWTLEVGEPWSAVDYNGFDRSGIGQHWTAVKELYSRVWVNGSCPSIGRFSLGVDQRLERSRRTTTRLLPGARGQMWCVFASNRGFPPASGRRLHRYGVT